LLVLPGVVSWFGVEMVDLCLKILPGYSVGSRLLSHRNHLVGELLSFFGNFVLWMTLLVVIEAPK
jgi:hypothetical protein